MDLEQLQKMFNGKIVENEDKVIDFDKPIKGKYRARITELKRMTGVGKTSGNDYDFIVLKAQITEDVEGEKSFNRYIDKIYGLVDSEFATAKDNMARLVSDLYTAGLLSDIELTDDNPETLVGIAGLLIDKIICVSLYPNKPKDGKPEKQVVRIVKEFDVKAPESTNW